VTTLELSDKTVALVKKEVKKPLSNASLRNLPPSTQSTLLAVRAERWWQKREDGSFGPELSKLVATDLDCHITTARDRVAQMRDTHLVDISGIGKGRKYRMTLPAKLEELIAEALSSETLASETADQAETTKATPKKKARRKAKGKAKVVVRHDTEPDPSGELPESEGANDTSDDRVEEEDDSVSERLLLEDAARIIGIDPTRLRVMTREWRILEGVDVAALQKQLFATGTSSTWRSRDTQLVSMLADQIEQDTDDRTGNDYELNRQLWAELIVRAFRRLAAS